jgi:hypothetical protein
MFDEGRLQWMEVLATRDSFDRCDLSAVLHDSECQAGKNPLAIEQHGTRPTGALVTAFFGSREVKGFTQNI